MYEDYTNLYNKYKDKPFSEEVVYECKKEWDALTDKYLSRWSKEQLIDSLKTMWTLLNDEMGSRSRNEQYENFLAALDWYSDRMNINRWCRLQLLIGNAESH